MADNPRKYGFRWVKSLTGRADSPPMVKYPLASGYAPTVGGTGVNLHAGDPMQILSTGYAGICIGTEGTQSRLYGVIAGFSPEWDGSLMQPRDKHISGSGAYSTNFERQNFVYLIPFAGQLFELDCDDAVTATTYAAYLAFIGENCDMVLAADTTNAGDPRVTSQIDIATHAAATATLQLRLEGISDTLENRDFSGNYVKLYVSANVTQQAPYYTTGV